MRLILVRHGESVDNVAGLYAGSRDSALTAHGVLQTRRLGAHLAALPALAGPAGSAVSAVSADAPARVVVTHIYSSDLQRASATASAVLDAQRKRGADDKHAVDAEASRGPEPAGTVIVSADLRERDFRSGEGVRFGASAGPAGSKSTGRNAFADAESWDEMSVRAQRFVDGHLRPLLCDGVGSDEDGRRAVVVVAHGLILNVVLSTLLLRFAPAELARLQPAAPVAGRGLPDGKRTQLHVPWSNTGYLVLLATKPEPGRETDGDANAVQMQVLQVNCTEHLEGLKKTRGGIGSARFDPKQKTMDAFFGPAAKRQKRGGAA